MSPEMTDEFWSDRFHFCALAAGFIASAEGRLDDALYVRELAYAFYKEGAFHDRANRVASAVTPSPLRHSRKAPSGR